MTPEEIGAAMQSIINGVRDGNLTPSQGYVMAMAGQVAVNATAIRLVTRVRHGGAAVVPVQARAGRG